MNYRLEKKIFKIENYQNYKHQVVLVVKHQEIHLKWQNQFFLKVKLMIVLENHYNIEELIIIFYILILITQNLCTFHY